MPHHFPVSCISVCVCVFCRFCLLPHVWLSVQSPSAHVGEPFHGEYPSTKCTLGALIGSSRQFSVNCDGILSKPGCCSHPASLVFAGECLPQSGDVKKSFHLTPLFPHPFPLSLGTEGGAAAISMPLEYFHPPPTPLRGGSRIHAALPPLSVFVYVFVERKNRKTNKNARMQFTKSLSVCARVSACCVCATWRTSKGVCVPVDATSGLCGSHDASTTFLFCWDALTYITHTHVLLLLFAFISCLEV